MRPRPTPRFSLPASDRPDPQIRFRSQTRVARFFPNDSDDDDDDCEERQAKANTAESSHSGTDIARVKREGEPRLSSGSEAEVLAHATGASADLLGPKIAVINPADHSGDEGGEDEDDADEDDEDENRRSGSPEDDALGRPHGSPPGPEGPNDDQEESASARAVEIDVKAATAELLQSDEDDDDEKFSPHLLFSQSQNRAASQVQRQIAADLSSRDLEEEEDRTVVKEPSPDFPIIFSGPRSVTGNHFFPQSDYIMVDSSPEPRTPTKGPLKRPAELISSTTPPSPAKRMKETRNTGLRNVLTTPITPRQKQESSGEVPIHEFKRDEDLWYLDGSVIIQIGCIGFRLHGSLLSERFDYFNALFSSGARPTRIIDKTPVYEVEGNVDDFKKLHRYMQDPWDADVSFHGLAPIARAAHLFGMQGALRHIAKLLDDIYSQEYIGSRGNSFAAEAIGLADSCPSLTFMVKPAMYDLLCQPEFRFVHNTTNRDVSDVFGVPQSRILQLLAARNELQDQWQNICSPEACLGDFDAAPTNKCLCAKMFENETLDAELSEDEVFERKMQRRERMLTVWFNALYGPPTSPTAKEPADAPVEKAKTQPLTQGGAQSDRKWPELTQKIPAIKSIIAAGNTDIILGLNLLAEQTWEDLECKTCIAKRRKKWRRKQEHIWKMLNRLFGVEDNNGEDHDDS